MPHFGDQSLNLTLVGPIIEDAKALLDQITRVVITHICGQANDVAHRLARLTLLCNRFCSWSGEPPYLSFVYISLTIWSFNETLLIFKK
ncbi:hypothetical protein ACFX1W_026689 [Malus domestica]